VAFVTPVRGVQPGREEKGTLCSILRASTGYHKHRRRTYLPQLRSVGPPETDAIINQLSNLLADYWNRETG